MKNKIKLILKSVRENKKYAIITPIFMTIEALFECLLPFVMNLLVGSIKYVRTGSDMLNGSYNDLYSESASP